MDYEKAYKKALERARNVHKYSSDIAEIKRMEYIFSELAESEDDKIRNFISNELTCLRATTGKGSDRYEELTNAIAWLEKQGETFTKKDVDNAYIEGMAFAKDELEKQKPTWSEEDERLCSCLIKEQEESLDNVRNDKYGHSEIISDLKDMYHERIDWLKSLKQRIGG